MPLLQISRKTGRTRSAIRFADQKFRREPAVIPRGIQTDKISDRLNILFEAMPFLRLHTLHGSAVASIHRVNENQISLIENRKLIISQLIVRRRQLAIVLHQHPSWT